MRGERGVVNMRQRDIYLMEEDKVGDKVEVVGWMRVIDRWGEEQLEEMQII